jgi:CheY-like chemotaxis protein/DNA-binding XRE family transcriptional regulator
MTKVNVRKEFGATVRAHRLRLGLSQETLAERARLHRTYVTDVERGARNISLESISRLAHALDLSISSLFPPARSSSGEGTGGPSASRRNVDILLVEDDPADIELTLAAFSTARLSNHIEVVRDGAAALDFLFRRGVYAQRRQERDPLVVLLDLHLPKVHGLEVLQRLRADERTRTLRVVVLSNSSQDADVHQALRLGAQAYIVKPLDFQALSSVTPQLDCSWALLNPVEPAARVGLPRTSLKS